MRKYTGVKCKVDNPLDAVDAEDAGPGGTTVVPGRAARRAKRAAEDADGAGEKAAQWIIHFAFHPWS